MTCETPSPECENSCLWGDRMDYSTLIEDLLTAVPELKDSYSKYIEWWGEGAPGPHVVFGDVLDPFLLRLLSNPQPDHLLQRIFAFLEDMGSSEELVQEVLVVTVLERLSDDPKILEAARPLMGPTTRRLLEEMETWKPEG